MSALDHIGNTRVMRLNRIRPTSGASIWLKLEYENPTGSMKDRMALAMIEGAEADGRLQPGGSVVEYTGGSTGVSLAFVCAAKGYPLTIVTSPAFSQEKRDHMRALGAELVLIESATGGTTETLTKAMIEAARELAASPGCYWTDQLNNADPLPMYDRMAEELVEQLPALPDAYVQSVGTGGSFRGITAGLRRHQPELRAVAVEPAESAVLSGGPTGSHKIEGTGAGFVVPLWDPEVADEIERVSTQEAMAMARRLATEEAIFAGTSTGANLVAALRVGEGLNSDASILTIACDTGMKYLSTDLYRSNPGG